MPNSWSSSCRAITFCEKASLRVVRYEKEFGNRGRPRLYNVPLTSLLVEKLVCLPGRQGVAFEISTRAESPHWGCFSIIPDDRAASPMGIIHSIDTGRVDRMYDALGFCCLSDLQLVWNSGLTIEEVAGKYVKWLF